MWPNSEFRHGARTCTAAVDVAWDGRVNGLRLRCLDSLRKTAILDGCMPALSWPHIDCMHNDLWSIQQNVVAAEP